MESFVTFCIPIATLLFLALFAGIIIPWQAKSSTDRGTDTTAHSERIYKDFEMYLKVTLGLVAAFGYIRIDKMSGATEVVAREALIVIGAISLFVMVTFCIFIISHQASKVRRWENIEWGKAVFWQELWACLAMWLFSSSIWVAAHVW
jgi:hypothetical protein